MGKKKQNCNHMELQAFGKFFFYFFFFRSTNPWLPWVAMVLVSSVSLTQQRHFKILFCYSRDNRLGLGALTWVLGEGLWAIASTDYSAMPGPRMGEVSAKLPFPTSPPAAFRDSPNLHIPEDII